MKGSLQSILECCQSDVTAERQASFVKASDDVAAAQKVSLPTHLPHPCPSFPFLVLLSDISSLLTIISEED